MKIYIDFDDVICETGREFSDLVKRMFDIDVPYEEMHYFALDKTFGLNPSQFEAMMIEGHRPEALLSHKETPGACDTIERWCSKGHEVFVITGRPASAYDASRQWLDLHGLSAIPLYCVNKYGRDSFIKNSDFSIELDEYYKMHFDFAVEDSPVAFKHLAHLPECRVAVISRPWNKAAELPSDKYRRCSCWEEIDKYLEEA